MSEALQFLAAPFVMCLLLVGIHCYLGLHILARGVVFVDLSLAQVASLGATFALLFIDEKDTHVHYFVSLSATLMASALFAYARRFDKYVSQEALIGITFAFASAAVVLVLDRLPHGAEHLKEALIGQILWVSWSEVFKTFGIYALVGAAHWFCRNQFLQSSFEKKPVHWMWDFFFYALFGVVITSSTSTAGVLVVFSFLIVPATMGTLFFKSLIRRMIFGWLLGSVMSLLAMIVSYKMDLPVGATLVVLLTALPIMTLPFHKAR